ncbi:methyl farnesoate epoxidase-like [Onthophagus taurus]|uniref:methyl farnesoate epoxidase-like n=1 Tax=Onthophagus taurus TaxID=166361 RepID=UPI0039BE45C9
MDSPVYIWLLVLFLLSLLLFFDLRRPKHFPPGPKWLPFIGNIYLFLRLKKQLKFNHLVWQKLSEKFGSIVGLKMGRDLVVGVSGVEAIEEIMIREEFSGRPDGLFFRMRTFGQRLGLVFSDGPLWQTQRKFVLHHLKSLGLGRKEMELGIIEETKVFVEFLKNKNGNPMPMQHVFDVAVLNVLWFMTSSERFSLENEKMRELIDLIHKAFNFFDISGGILNQLPFLRYVAPNLCYYNQHLEMLKKMWSFLEETIENHQETFCKLYSRDLIDSYLVKMHENDKTFSNDQLKSLLLDIFMAGSETTSNTLEFSIFYMLKYPEIQTKVQNELDVVVGRSRWPMYSDKLNLPYTEAVLMEIQRQTNVPPLGIAHRAIETTELMGYKIPEGTTILTNIFSVHMDKDYWGDPEIFRPERFLKNGKIFNHGKYFLPYGNGKRRCLGESLAKVNYFLFFTAILHNFRIELPPGSKLCEEKNDGVTLSPKPFEAMFVARTD